MTRTQRPGSLGVRITTLCAVAALLAAAGCSTIRLIGPYDEVIDKGATEAEKKMDMHFAVLARGGDGAAYDPRFYDDLRSTVRTLRTRAATDPKNSVTVEQLDLLLKSINDLEMYHKGKGERPMVPEEVEPLQRAFDQHFAAIIKLELAKKRGE